MIGKTITVIQILPKIGLITGFRMTRNQEVKPTVCITFPKAMTVPIKMIVFQLKRVLKSFGVKTLVPNL